jgi:hypothetical protein
LSGYLRARVGRDPAGREFQNEALGIFRGGTGRHLCQAKKTSEGRMTAAAPHSYWRLPKPTRGYCVRCSVGRNSTRLNPLRNVSQVAVLGQLVSDGAHSILDPAGRFLGLSHHHQVASAGEWYGKGFHTRSKFSDAQHRSVDAVTHSAVNRKDRAGSRQ